MSKNLKKSDTRRRHIIEETISAHTDGINFQRERRCWQFTVYKIAQSTKTLSEIMSSNIVYEGQQHAFKLTISQTYIFNMWNILEIHYRSSNAVRQYRGLWLCHAHDHVWQIFGTNVESWPTPLLATFHTSLRSINHIPRYIYVLQLLRLSALIWPRKTVWWHSCGRAIQKLENYYFICNTEQPRFIPTMPTVNNNTWMNKLNTTENTVS